MQDGHFRVFANPLARKETRYEVQTPLTRQHFFLFNKRFCEQANKTNSPQHRHCDSLGRSRQNKKSYSVKMKDKMTPRNITKKPCEPSKASASRTDSSEKGVPALPLAAHAKRLAHSNEQGAPESGRLEPTPRRHSRSQSSPSNEFKSKYNPPSYRSKPKSTFSEESRSKMSPLYKSKTSTSQELYLHQKTPRGLSKTSKSQELPVNQKTPRGLSKASTSQELHFNQRTPRGPSKPQVETSPEPIIYLERGMESMDLCAIHKRSQSFGNKSAQCSSRITASSSPEPKVAHRRTLSAEIEEMDLFFEERGKSPTPVPSLPPPSTVNSSIDNSEIDSMSHMCDDMSVPSLEEPIESFAAQKEEERYKDNWQSRTKRAMPKILAFLGEVTLISVEIFLGIFFFNETAKIRNKAMKPKEKNKEKLGKIEDIARKSTLSRIEEEKHDDYYDNDDGSINAEGRESLWRSRKLSLSYFSEDSMSEASDHC